MSQDNTTIIYYTDNSIDESLSSRVRELLLESADGIPIVCVSQKPVDFAQNICVGDIGRSWLSLYKQLFEGLKTARTKYVAMAEHDCVYAKEHFRWIPPRDDTFYYNDNCWLLQLQNPTHPEQDGVFSHWPKRFALSQLVCSRDILLKSTEKRLDVIDADRGLIKRLNHIGEPGFTQPRGPKWERRLERAQKYAKSGSCAYLQPMIDALMVCLGDEKAELFKTKTPNIDIRHGTNFTGPKRGKNRTRRLEPWGELEDIITNTRMNAR